MDKDCTYLETGEAIECRRVREEVAISTTYTEDVVLHWDELLANMLANDPELTD